MSSQETHPWRKLSPNTSIVRDGTLWACPWSVLVFWLGWSCAGLKHVVIAAELTCVLESCHDTVNIVLMQTATTSSSLNLPPPTHFHIDPWVSVQRGVMQMSQWKLLQFFYAFNGFDLWIFCWKFFCLHYIDVCLVVSLSSSKAVFFILSNAATL